MSAAGGRRNSCCWPRTAVTARPEECAQPASAHVLLSGAYEAPPTGAGEVPSGKGRLRRRPDAGTAQMKASPLGSAINRAVFPPGRPRASGVWSATPTPEGAEVIEVVPYP